MKDICRMLAAVWSSVTWGDGWRSMSELRSWTGLRTARHRDSRLFWPNGTAGGHWREKKVGHQKPWHGSFCISFLELPIRQTCTTTQRTFNGGPPKDRSIPSLQHYCLSQAVWHHGRKGLHLCQTVFDLLLIWSAGPCVVVDCSLLFPCRPKRAWMSTWLTSSTPKRRPAVAGNLQAFGKYWTDNATWIEIGHVRKLFHFTNEQMLTDSWTSIDHRNGRFFRWLPVAYIDLWPHTDRGAQLFRRLLGRRGCE